VRANTYCTCLLARKYTGIRFRFGFIIIIIIIIITGKPRLFPLPPSTCKPTIILSASSYPVEAWTEHSPIKNASIPRRVQRTRCPKRPVLVNYFATKRPRPTNGNRMGNGLAVRLPFILRAATTMNRNGRSNSVHLRVISDEIGSPLSEHFVSGLKYATNDNR